MTSLVTPDIEARPMPQNHPTSDAATPHPGQYQACPQPQAPLPAVAAPADGPSQTAPPGNPVGHESHARTIVKSLSWRFVALIMTASIAWGITRRIELAASIGLADTLVKLVVYYLHERLWLKVRFGRERAPEYEI